jgi:hypothetical protein
MEFNNDPQGNANWVTNCMDGFCTLTQRRDKEELVFRGFTRKGSRGGKPH